MLAPMTTRKPNPQEASVQRRRLELLASFRDGCTEAIMRPTGSRSNDGLATAQAEHVVAGGRSMDMVRARSGR